MHTSKNERRTSGTLKKGGGTLPPNDRKRLILGGVDSVSGKKKKRINGLAGEEYFFEGVGESR